MAAAAAATVATMGIAACGVMREPEYLWKLRIGGASNQQHARRRAGEPDTQHRHKRKQTSGEGVRFSFPVHAGSGASESCKCKGKVMM